MQNLNKKMPPNNIQAEQTVLGAALSNQDCAFYVIELLNEDDFYTPAHRTIFNGIRLLHKQNDNIDIVSIVNELEKMESLETIGGPAYISSISDLIPSITEVKGHAKLIKHKADLRRTIQIATEIVDRCYHDNGTPAATMIENLEKIVYEASMHRKIKGFKSISNVLTRAIGTIEKLYNGEIESLGLKTGYDDLDFILNGLKPAELVIIAGRPSMGKTALAMNIIENMAGQGHAQAIFSLEMDKESLALRSISSQAKVDSFKLRSGKLLTGEWHRIKDAQEKLSAMGIFIDDAAGLTPYEIRSRARRLKAKSDIKAIWIDYLQLSHAKGRSREEETATISREFKAMAKELQVPVIALSQLNRSCENRPDKRPMLSDLRDSGAIEQDGDVIMFIYRDEVYNKSDDNPLKGTAEVIIRKNRNGPIGTIELVWRGGFTRFENKRECL